MYLPNPVKTVFNFSNSYFANGTAATPLQHKTNTNIEEYIHIHYIIVIIHFDLIERRKKTTCEFIFKFEKIYIKTINDTKLSLPCK